MLNAIENKNWIWGQETEKRERKKNTFVAHFSFISRDKRYVVDHRLASGIFEC